MKTHQPRRQLKFARLGILAIALAVVSAGFYALHASQVRRQAGTLLDRAHAAESQKDWKAAADFYRAYLNFQPHDIHALAGYATVLDEIALAKPATIPDAIKVYERLLQLDPTRIGDRRKLAKHYVVVGYVTGARDHLRGLLTPSEGGNPNDAEILELYATCELRERKVESGIAHLDRAVQTGKATAEAHLRLAFLLRYEVKTPESVDQADAVMARLIASRPDDIAARLARVRYRIRNGDSRLARADAEHAFRLPGGKANPEVLLAVAELAAAENDLATAREVLTAGVAASPDNLKLRVMLADVLGKQNDSAAAAKTLREAADRIPGATPQLLEIADKLIDVGDLTTPAQHAARLSADASTQNLGEYLAGRLKLAEGNWPAALPLLQKAATAMDRTPGYELKARLAIGQCYALANNPDQQNAAYASAVKLSASSTPARLGQADALAKLGQTHAAIELYQTLVRQVPGARAAVCRLQLAEVLAKPESERNWAAFEESLGEKPYPVDVHLVRARALIAQQKPREAEALLMELVTAAAEDLRPRIVLASMRGNRDPSAGLAVLADAQAKIGDRVDIRLARANLLLRQSARETRPILALAEETGSFSKPDRARLWSGLAELLAGSGHRAAAIDLYTRSAADAPYDIAVRSALFDLALAEKRADLQAKMLAEITKLEGPDGPIRIVAEVTRDLARFRPGEPTQPIRERLLVARSSRENWGRIHALLGDLDQIDGNSDAALDHYRKALELGERHAALARTAVRLMLDRHRHSEALGLLGRLAGESPLAADLAKQQTLLRSMFGEDPGKNLAWARSADTANSKDFRDHLSRATVFALNGSPDDAEKSLRQAVALNDTAPEAWVALVRFLAASGKKSEAEVAAREAAKRLRAAAEKGSDPTTVAVALGVCRELVGDFPAAESHFRDALKRSPADPVALRQLVDLFQQTNRKPDAIRLLEETTRGDAAPATKRWARRTLAFAKISGEDGHSQVSAALELVEENLRDGGNLLDDRRAKALVLAADPFRRADAIATLTETAKSVPLAPEENFLLAKLQIRGGKLVEAEQALRSATRAVAVAAPEHLATLCRVQLIRGDTAAAKETLARLKLAAPNTWLATAEEVRYLARVGNRREAVKLALSGTGKDDPDHLANRVGPLLEEIGSPTDAESAYRRSLDLAKKPTSHTPLASFYLRTGRQPDALALARKHADGCPVGVSARLLCAAIRSRPADTVPESERETWQKSIREVEAWVAAKLRNEPTHPDLLYAQAELDDAAGRYDAEIRVLELALRSAPDHDVYLNNLALVLALHSKETSGRALELINRAIAKRGPRPHLLDTRAVVLLAANRPTDALADLTVAIALDPRPVFRFHAALAYERTEQEPARDAALAEAKKTGLSRANLHPLEWADFERLCK